MFGKPQEHQRSAIGTQWKVIEQQGNHMNIIGNAQEHHMISYENHRKVMGTPEEIVGKQSENHGKSFGNIKGKPSENHRKIVAKSDHAGRTA